MSAKRETFKLEWKLCFIEYDVVRGDDSATLKIETPRTTVICWAAEEDTWCGSWTQLVCSSRSLVGKTQAAKNT